MFWDKFPSSTIWEGEAWSRILKNNKSLIQLFINKIFKKYSVKDGSHLSVINIFWKNYEQFFTKDLRFKKLKSKRYQADML